MPPKTLQDLSRTAHVRTRMLRGDLDPLQPLCILKCVCLLCFKASPLSFKIFWHWHRDAPTDLILLIFLIYNLHGSLTIRIAAFLISGYKVFLWSFSLSTEHRAKPFRLSFCAGQGCSPRRSRLLLQNHPFSLRKVQPRKLESDLWYSHRKLSLC